VYVVGLPMFILTMPFDRTRAIGHWYAQRWADPDGGAWQEFDLAKLAVDETFLRVSL